MFFIKNNYKFFVLIIVLLLILAYVTNITSIPESIILFENEQLNFYSILGLKIEETIQVGANVSGKENSNNQLMDSKKQYNLSLLGLNLKTITANIIPETRVVPLGNLIGLKLYTKGVLVVGTSQIKGEDNKTYKPYEQAGITQGDSIIQINGQTVETTQELISCVSKCNGKEIQIEYLRDGQTKQTTLNPVKTEENTYKIGLWVRDAVAGVGTATFYNTSTNTVSSLGHGIQDIDTEELVKISEGEFTNAEILEIERGAKEHPGKIEGTIEEKETIGKIYSNTEFGVYGEITNKSVLNIDTIQEVEVASRNEIELGKATVICTLENEERKEYEIEIQKIYINNNENNKSMLVKVTDEKLLEKTGGIIQGMSGSPIIQNGKLIGALTHVLLSDPTKRLRTICRHYDFASK